jgi:carbohydrate diacid regulator
VFVTDEAGATIADSEPHRGLHTLVRRDYGDDEVDSQPELIRVPLRAYGQSGEVIVTEPLNGESVSPRVARVLAEMTISQRFARFELQEQLQQKSKFVHDLLKGQIKNTADAVQEAELYGFDLMQSWALLLMDASGYIMSSRTPATLAPSKAIMWQRAANIVYTVPSFFPAGVELVCAYIGDGKVAVLRLMQAASSHGESGLTGEARASRWSPSWESLHRLQEESQALLEGFRGEFGGDARVGIGLPRPGIRGLGRTYHEAMAALSMGPKLQVDGSVYALSSLGTVALVGIADATLKAELAEHVLTPLADEPYLLATLRAFFEEECVPSRCAGRLAIHRNTLSYRLDQITLLTGLNPRNFNDAVELRLALLVHTLGKDDS